MNARIEAAAKVTYEMGIGSWEGAHEDTREVEREDMAAALAAADAVMFSDDAVERGARAMFAEEQCDRRQKLDVDGNWKSRLDDRDRDEYRRLTRAVIAALRDVPSGAVGAGGAVVAPEDGGAKLGPENGAGDVCPKCSGGRCIDCDGTVKAEGWGWDTCPCKCNPASTP